MGDEDGRIHLDVCYHVGALGWILAWFLLAPLFVQVIMSAKSVLYENDLAFFLVYNVGIMQAWLFAKLYSFKLNFPRPAFGRACEPKGALPDPDVVYGLTTLLFLVFMAAVGRTRIGKFSALTVLVVVFCFCAGVILNEYLSWPQLAMASGFALVHVGAWGTVYYMMLEPMSHGMLGWKWVRVLGFNEDISNPRGWELK